MTSTIDRDRRSSRSTAPAVAGQAPRQPLALAVALIVLGAAGWIAAFALTLDKFAVIADKNAALSCNISVLVQCGTNLKSAQGSLLGFPNPLLGLGGFVAPIAVGVGILAGARFARWFWAAFNAGVALAMAFVVFLVITSIYFLGTLCPWCMLVWTVTIPMFVSVTAYCLKTGVWSGSDAVRRAGASVLTWTPAITVGALLLIAVLAQLRLDVVNSLF